MATKSRSPREADSCGVKPSHVTGVGWLISGQQGARARGQVVRMAAVDMAIDIFEELLSN